MGLESFVDLTDPTAREPAEEGEDDMSSLAAGFAAWMCKRVVSSQGETMALKCQTTSTPNGLVWMERLRTVRLLSLLILQNGLRTPCWLWRALPRKLLRSLPRHQRMGF